VRPGGPNRCRVDGSRNLGGFRPEPGMAQREAVGRLQLVDGHDDQGSRFSDLPATMLTEGLPPGSCRGECGSRLSPRRSVLGRTLYASSVIERGFHCRI
jgi:hypothetical protein